MLAAFTVVCHVVKMMVSPSSSNQTGITWGRPSVRTVASFPVLVPLKRKIRHSGEMVIMGFPFSIVHDNYYSSDCRRIARLVGFIHFNLLIQFCFLRGGLLLPFLGSELGVLLDLTKPTDEEWRHDGEIDKSWYEQECACSSLIGEG